MSGDPPRGSVISAADSRDKSRAAGLSIASNSVLAAAKFVGAIATGSVGLLSEAFHSAADVLGSALVMLSVRVASAPPDDEHPYGHAKVECVSGLAEAAVLGLLGLYVIGQGVEHLWLGVTVRRAGAGVAIAAACAAVSGIAGWYVLQTGRRTRSTALTVNGFHLLTDLVTSSGVAIALLAVKLFGFQWADGAIGVILGAWLAFSAFRIGYGAFQQLIDRRLSDADFSKIKSIIAEEVSLISFHRLRTRLSGSVRYIDFHIVVPNTWSVVEAHLVADRLEHRLRSELEPSIVVIHVDPYDEAKADR